MFIENEGISSFPKWHVKAPINLILDTSLFLKFIVSRIIIKLLRFKMHTTLIPKFTLTRAYLKNIFFM